MKITIETDLRDDRKLTASKILRILHELGGCDATDEYCKGWDEAINAAYNEISKEYKVVMEERDD